TLNAATRVLTLYIDGAPVSSTTLTSISTAGNTAPVSLGRTSATNAQYFHGKLDDVRVWHASRTSAQIQATYLTAITTAPTGVVPHDFARRRQSHAMRPHQRRKDGEET